MPQARKPRPRSARPLLEWSAAAPSGSPLVVDRGAGVIAGVKVLGFRSRNSHGLEGAENGTEYTRACMEAALPKYEGTDVLVDHDAGPSRKGRSSADVFGRLRNVRMADDGIRADLHFLKSHPLADRVCEDVERGLGVFGLSHDARAGRERFDRRAKRLVIESIASVNSVDLVRRPATNRNLWESEPVPKTNRQIIEGLDLTPNRDRWRKHLLEDDEMAPMLDAEPVGEGDHEDALWSGFAAAIQAICEGYKSGELDAKAAGKKVVQYLKAHAGLSDDAAPAPGAEGEGEGDEGEGKKDPPESDKDKTEAVKELAALKHKLAVRELLESAGVKADRTLTETLEDLPIDKARKLVEREKARGTAARPTSSGAPGKAGPAKGKTFLDRITG